MARIALSFMISIVLAGCGNEGPFGNTPGPKKPTYSDEFWKIN